MMQQPPTSMVPPPMAPPSMDQQQYHQQQWSQHPPPPQVYHPQVQPHPIPPPMWNQQPPPQVYQPHYATVPPSQPQLQPQPQVQPQYGASPQPKSADEIRTLWIGDLQYYMDEEQISSWFASTGEVLSVKVIRNKQSNVSEGYGFIEFATRATAERVLQTYNGTPIPNYEPITFRLNWATLSSGEKRDDSAEHTIFVGDLAADVTDYMLQETFRTNYPSVKGAKVVTDRITGRTKGYGFVKFGDESEQVRAMNEMNGMFCSTRQMRIGPATSKKNPSGQQQYTKASYQIPSTENENDPNNTTIFVGGLDSNVTEDHLRQTFTQFGDLAHVKIPVGKRCGFVQFVNRACAEEALLMLNGTQLGGQSIRLSWGRSPANKQPQPDPNQWNSGYYGYNQGYEAYGYAPAAQDPNMYAYGAYPAAYGNYQQQPQQ